MPYKLGLSLIGFGLWMWGLSASAQQIHTVPHREATQAYAVIEPAQPARGLMLLYTGGEGILHLQELGRISSPNVLFRIREALSAAGLRLVYVDRPEGPHSRSDAAYARAAAEILRRENTQQLPVFVAGISRGSISAANVAARVPVSGMILLSTVTGSTYDGTVRDAPIPDITAAALLLLHNRDACTSSGSERALRAFARELKHASVLVLAGGTDEAPGAGRSAYCHPRSYHGFNGLEDKVADAILGWIGPLL